MQLQSNNNSRRDQFKGTAIVYKTDRDELDIDTADFQLDFAAETDRKQLRAYHLRRLKQDKMPHVPRDALHRGIAVVVGTGASPNYVVQWLSLLIRHIKKNELVIGTTRNGKFLTQSYIPGKRVRKRKAWARKRPFVIQL